MERQTLASHREGQIRMISGWLMLPLLMALLVGDIWLVFYCIVHATTTARNPDWSLLIPALVFVPVIIILLTGFFTLQPNEARVLILFGAYKGTVRDSGFHWGSPFYSNGGRLIKQRDLTSQRRIPSRYKISLRARTLNGEKLKVNDKRGNPIEIAAVVIWRVGDTAQAMFDVDDYEKYVQTQSETSLRHIASTYAYDDGEEGETTLRSGVDEISQGLRKELQDRLGKAGVIVDEARLTHLAYASEIAQAMLRRQQAEAVIAARRKIVHGAVSMVEMALKDLAEKQVVALDDERKAAMVSNLMVVLCGESEVHPVINTGTLYT